MGLPCTMFRKETEVNPVMIVRVPVLPALATCLAATLGLAALALAPPKAAEEAGDPRKGLRNLLTRPYGGPMLTVTEYDRLASVWEPEWKKRIDPSDPLSARRVALARYGFVPTPEPDGKALLPVQFVRTGDSMTATCMLCHAGREPGSGRLNIGLPNTVVDMATFLDDLYRVRGTGAGGAFFNMTRGRTNATFFSHALLMQRDPDLSLRKTPAAIGFPAFADEDAPAWWNLRPRQSLYVDGALQGPFHRAIMQFAMQGNPDGAAIRSWESDFVDILAYLKSTQAPKYPWPIDRTAAAAGRSVFDRNCASCHGTYGSQPIYPDRVVPIGVIGTDPARLQAVTPAFRNYLGKSWFGGLSSARDVAPGYVAPPLNGIWATAPYLHNGSVPTLYGILTEAARPQIFRRVGDFRAYDTRDVGWKVRRWTGPPPRACRRRPAGAW